MASKGDDPLKNGDNHLAPLIQLQSKDHEEILNVIDQLRSEGISKYVSLPQLIVCGDQSSGKSSVLEAISGLSFPAKDNVCTRFATELILRRSPNVGIRASIHADEERPSAEQRRIRGFKSSTVDLGQFASIVRQAEKHIGVGPDRQRFSKDVLRVEVSGPTQPHLTLVDLPGLYHAPDEFQTAEGVDFVESLVLSYIRNKRSVILAVVSAKSDIALQKVTTFTREVDPVGNRTMGIITKPDTLPRGSEMEKSFFDLAMNTRLTFRLGWHVLKNREHEQQNFTLQQRRESEINFLSRGIWAKMPRSLVGIDYLRPRLSTVLKDHITSQLPGLIAEVQQSCKDAEAGLQRLGKARQTLTDQRRYLLDSSDRFSTLIGHAIDGIYSSPFFGDAMEDEGYEKRLRAVVQNRLSDFAETVYEMGMQRKIIEDEEPIEPEENQIHRSDLVSEVQQRMRRSRGRELPGTFNPLIIGDLFYLQSRPWESIVTECIDNLLGDVRRAIMPILQGVLDEKSLRSLLEYVINPNLEKIEEALRVKATELLKPQQSGHPITYNHYFTESVQEAREEHLRRSLRENLREFFGKDYPSQESWSQKYSFRMDELIAALGTQTEANMERFAASEAIDCMLAYYKAST
ncbi:Dynamin central domain-containing protein [Cladophialophora immunda]|nr:Dynamin central domain-containing protein [Cladophialophora immunda]